MSRRETKAGLAIDVGGDLERRSRPNLRSRRPLLFFGLLSHLFSDHRCQALPPPVLNPITCFQSHVGRVWFLSKSIGLVVMLCSIERAISYRLAAGVSGWA